MIIDPFSKDEMDQILRDAWNPYVSLIPESPEVSGNLQRQWDDVIEVMDDLDD